MASLSTFIAELKRRRVFRVAAVYGGVAFVLVQIIDGTFEVMGIPAWVSRLAILLLTLGFPLAVGLAWVFDITPEGIVRTGKAGGPAALRPAPLAGQGQAAYIQSGADCRGPVGGGLRGVGPLGRGRGHSGDDPIHRRTATG